MDSAANRLWKKDGERAKKEGRWGGQQLANSQPDYKTSYKTKATSTNDQLARPYTTDELCHSISLSPAYPSVSRFSSIDFFKVRPAGPEHARLNKRCLLAEFGNFFPSPRFFYSPFFFLLLFHLLFFVLLLSYSFGFSCSTFPGRLSPSEWNIQRDHSHSWRISLFRSLSLYIGCFGILYLCVARGVGVRPRRRKEMLTNVYTLVGVLCWKVLIVSQEFWDFN